MKAKLFLALNALVLLVAATCSYYKEDSLSPNDIDIQVRALGTTYDAGATDIPSDTRQVYVVASVKAAPGDWDLKLEASGALSFPSGDAGAVTATLHATDVNERVEVELPAVPETPGEAVIRATLGSVVRTFRFTVTPIKPMVDVCRLDADGECLPDPMDEGTGGDPYFDDAGARVVPFPVVPKETLRDGEEIGITIDGSEASPGATWSIAITTDGVIVMVDKDNQTTRSRTIEWSPTADKLIVPARISGSGVGRIFASIGKGPQGSRVVDTFSASTVARRIQFLSHVGLSAKNLVTLCSSRRSGSIRVMLEPDAGSVAPESNLLSVVPGGPCEAPFPGQAEVVWTGNQAHPIWTITDEKSDASTFVPVPMLGAEVLVRADTKSVWLSKAPDAGSGGSGGAGSTGSTGKGGAGTGGTGGGSTGSTSTGSASTAPPVNRALVTGTLYRNALDEDGGPDGSDLSERLANTSVNVKAPTGITADPKQVMTDANGEFSFEVAITKGTLATEVILLVDQQFSITVNVIPDN